MIYSYHYCMSYTETVGKIGEYETLSVVSESGSAFTIIPALGARLNSFVVPTKAGPVEVIDGYQDDKELATEYYSKSSLLAPFPNRIVDGCFTFAGERFELPINKPAEHNAIHGFVSDKQFAVVERGEVASAYQVRLEYKSVPVQGFPFPFSVAVTYVLDADGHLTVQTALENTGLTDMPAGFGWHPYFTLGIPVDQLLLSLPTRRELVVDARLIPTGELIMRDSEYQKPIAAAVFDTGFQLLQEKEIVLTNPETKVSLRLICSEGFDYLQVFTPPWRTAIALEPMTCAADAFNNGFGMKVLAPGEELTATFVVHVTVG